MMLLVNILEEEAKAFIYLHLLVRIVSGLFTQLLTTPKPIISLRMNIKVNILALIVLVHSLGLLIIIALMFCLVMMVLELLFIILLESILPKRFLLPQLCLLTHLLVLDLILDVLGQLIEYKINFNIDILSV